MTTSIFLEDASIVVEADGSEVRTAFSDDHWAYLNALLSSLFGATLPLSDAQKAGVWLHKASPTRLSDEWNLKLFRIKTESDWDTVPLELLSEGCRA